jgi:hypothetical protein
MLAVIKMPSVLSKLKQSFTYPYWTSCLGCASFYRTRSRTRLLHYTKFRSSGQDRTEAVSGVKICIVLIIKSEEKVFLPLVKETIRDVSLGTVQRTVLQDRKTSTSYCSMRENVILFDWL